MQITGRVNHTGRKKLGNSEVDIKLDSSSTPPSFTAEMDFGKYNFPAEADIYIEAYHRNTLQRFSFGTVAAPAHPESTLLSEIDLSGPTLFRVKVVDQSEHASRLLALADRVMPSDDNDENQKASLMIFKSTPLGELSWKMSYNDSNKPVLCINSRIPQGKDQLLHNPFFQSLIIPAAFREVLLYILWEQEEDDDVSEDSWQKKWMDFAEEIATYDKPHEEDQLYDWIDDVVSEFSNQHKFSEHLVKRMESYSDE